MKLTKKEISENVNCKRISSVSPQFGYEASVRGFKFETVNPTGELYEEDESGHMTFVESVNNKKEVVNTIFEWFKEYASHEFED